MTAEDELTPQDKIQQELRRARKFSIADVISQEAGNFLKGDSPVPQLVQAKMEVNQFIDHHLPDPTGALKPVLQRWVSADEVRLSRQLANPLQALADVLEAILANSESLYELVRQTDMEWGRQYDERPLFQRPGQIPHPDDEYTHESVHRQVQILVSIVHDHLKSSK